MECLKALCLKVLERVLANHGAKRRKKSIDTTFSTISPVVRIILEKSYDKISQLGELHLYNPPVAEKARRILCKLDSIVEAEQKQGCKHYHLNVSSYY